MKIFLDACVIIYWVEAAEPFYSTLIAKLKDIDRKYPDHEITVSRLSFLECLTLPLRNKDHKILELYRTFFELPELVIIEIDRDVIDKATQLRAKYGLRTPDAIQAASCMTNSKKNLFLTNDKGFKKVDGLNSVLL